MHLPPPKAYEFHRNSGWQRSKCLSSDAIRVRPVASAQASQSVNHRCRTTPGHQIRNSKRDLDATPWAQQRTHVDCKSQSGSKLYYPFVSFCYIMSICLFICKWLRIHPTGCISTLGNTWDISGRGRCEDQVDVLGVQRCSALAANLNTGPGLGDP